MKKLFSYFSFSKFISTFSGKIIALNLFVFAIMQGYNYIQEKTFTLSDHTVGQFGAILPHQSAWYSVITMMFLHGSIAHVLCNCISLLSISASLEKHAKNWFLPVYLLTGIISGITVYFFGKNWTLGASGAVCGIWAMLIVYNLKYNRTKVIMIGTIIDLSLLVYLSSLPNVSALGHFSGFIAGLILGLVYFTYFFKPEVVEPSPSKELENPQYVEEKNGQNNVLAM